jgi:hypothetical protein
LIDATLDFGAPCFVSGPDFQSGRNPIKNLGFSPCAF